MKHNFDITHNGFTGTLEFDNDKDFLEFLSGLRRQVLDAEKLVKHMQACVIAQDFQYNPNLGYIEQIKACRIAYGWDLITAKNFVEEKKEEYEKNRDSNLALEKLGTA